MFFFFQIKFCLNYYKIKKPTTRAIYEKRTKKIFAYLIKLNFIPKLDKYKFITILFSFKPKAS